MKKTISTLLIIYLMMIKSLNMMLPKASARVKSYDEQTKWMY